MRTWDEAVLREFNLHPLWLPRQTSQPAVALVPPTVSAAPVAEALPIPSEPTMVAPADIPASAEDNWETLNHQVDSCQSCSLRQHCATPKLGEQTQADWLFVSEAQGADEGENQQLLTAMLSAMQLRRGQSVAVVAALKCSLPEHRAPSAEQIAHCAPFLQRQIALTQPKLIIALGKTAAQALLLTTENLGSLRGRCHDYRGIPLIVTYHPAYLLRMPAEKAHAWQDLKLAMQTMQTRKGEL